MYQKTENTFAAFLAFLANVPIKTDFYATPLILMARQSPTIQPDKLKFS